MSVTRPPLSGVNNFLSEEIKNVYTHAHAQTLLMLQKEVQNPTALHVVIWNHQGRILILQDSESDATNLYTGCPSLLGPAQLIPGTRAHRPLPTGHSSGPKRLFLY